MSGELPCGEQLGLAHAQPLLVGLLERETFACAHAELVLADEQQEERALLEGEGSEGVVCEALLKLLELILRGVCCSPL